MKLQETVCVEATTWQLGGKEENGKQYYAIQWRVNFWGEGVKETAGESILKAEMFSWEKISCKYKNGQLWIGHFMTVPASYNFPNSLKTR